MTEMMSQPAEQNDAPSLLRARGARLRGNTASVRRRLAMRGDRRRGRTRPAAERPCFFHRQCRRPAEIEKQGKAVCRVCANEINGDEYPLRAPCREPLFWDANELALQLGMRERRRRDRAGIASGVRDGEDS